ncbi:MAG: T9SS type A sorting domain-containing protein, partial [Bacteroidia bacterium]|nr:T9SS type A sorting domain-containing protein [Bacteroidia bacterium]MDW8333180.1 T9SS type A sorting domain-containing protein [Bacteroidia bacterium]
INLSSTGVYNASGIVVDLGSVASGEFLVTGNTIGNATTPGLGITYAGNGLFRGIVAAHTCESPVQILNNVVGQITASGAGDNARIHGIATDSRRRVYINQNTVRNLTVIQTFNHNDLSWFPQENTSIVGILYNSTANPSGNQINQNTIFNLVNNSTNNSTSIARVTGIALSCSPWAVNSNGTCSRNRIYNLESTNPAAAMHWVTGIDYWAGNGWTFFNNQISLTNGSNTNNVMLIGFWEYNGILRPSHFHNNSIYIGGSSSSNSAAYYRVVRSTVQLRNNIFYNERGGAGIHTAITNANWDGAPADGWAAEASNYNLLVTANSSTVGGWGPDPSTVYYDFNGWRSVSNCDAYSLCTTSVSLPATNFFANIAAGDLGIQNNVNRWYVNGKGIAGPLVQNNSNDYNGTARSTTQGIAADIGSVEITAVTPAPHVLTQTITGTGTYNFNFAGNTYAKINVTVYDPSLTTLNVQYYSGVNPSNSGTAAKSNAYFAVTANGGATNYAYNITLAHTPAILGDIDNPADVIVSRSVACGGWYHYPFAPATPPNTTLSGNEATVSGVASAVGNFAFSDKDNPLAFPLPLSAAPTSTTAVLTWQNASGATGVTLRYRPVGSPTYTVVSPGLTTSTTITGLTPSTNYEFNVRSTCGGNTPYTRNFTFTTLPLRVGEAEDGQTVIYPNPTDGEIYVRFSTPNSEKAVVTVSDMNGRIVLSDHVTTVEGENQWKYSLEGKPAGLYFVQIASPSIRRTFKLTLR